MSSRLERLIAKVAIDEPDIVEPLKRIADEEPTLPLAEVWLRARREAYSSRRASAQLAAGTRTNSSRD
ncbi:MAG: hypothetical protein KDA69_21595 [Planctomycetaceae bacterium]|nr:hypothetical protein [Planctomycetaceae bacterium]